MGPSSRRHALFWSVVGLGVLADQVSKAVVAANFPEDSRETVPLVPLLLGIRRHRNYGALGGWGSQHPELVLGVSFLALGVILWLFLTMGRPRRLLDTALGLMMAGAVGNLIDRIYLGYVPDFIQFLFWPKYPIFNLADAWLTVGVALMVVGVMFGRHPEGVGGDRRPGRPPSRRRTRYT